MLTLIIGGLLYWREIHDVGHPVSPCVPPVPTPPQPPEESVAVPDNAPVDVRVTKPTRRDLVYTIKLPAMCLPLYQTTLYAKVSGYLKWIGPDKGDAVKKNDVVAVIDAPEVEEQYQQAVSDYKIKIDLRTAGESLERVAGRHRQTGRGRGRSGLSGSQAPDGTARRHAGITPKSAPPTTAS